MNLDRKKQEEEWFRQHELNDDQLERLIENKFNRAKRYHASFKKQEESTEELA